MSGGYFNHKELGIDDIIERIEDIIFNNDDDELNEHGDIVGRGYKSETIREFEKAVVALRLARTYAHRIDYLLSGDDGEVQFHERLAEELNDVLEEL